MQTQDLKDKKPRIIHQRRFANNPYELSTREIEVSKLLIEGKSIKTIADILSIKIKTVDSHIGMIYEKLGINNQTKICQRTVAVLKLKDLL